MGASIAVALAMNGLNVKIKELNAAAGNRGLKNIDDLLEKLVKKGLPPQEAKGRRSLIELVHSFDDLHNADLVIEAVVEDLQVKREVFQQLEQSCRRDCIFASNTSSLPITQIGSFIRSADRVIGLHFFNPAHVMKLVEVIPGLCTSHEIVYKAIAFGTRLGKLAVRVEECPSFLVNRLLARYLNESLWIVQERIAPVEVVDAAACQLLMPIGPCALRDMNGLDIGLAVGKFNFKEYGERFRPPPLLEKMVEAKLIGRKVLKGFYTYNEETKKSNGVCPDFLKLLKSMKKPKGAAKGELFDPKRLFLPMINEAFIALQEGICAPEQLDPALMAGLGMRKGPLEFAFELGLPNCLTQLEALFEEHGERFRPAPLLKRFVWAGKTSIT
jgi:3-hydroxyacyl-CoA dehydrogenase